MATMRATTRWQRRRRHIEWLALTLHLINALRRTLTSADSWQKIARTEMRVRNIPMRLRNINRWCCTVCCAWICIFIFFSSFNITRITHKSIWIGPLSIVVSVIKSNLKLSPRTGVKIRLIRLAQFWERRDCFGILAAYVVHGFGHKFAWHIARGS